MTWKIQNRQQFTVPDLSDTFWIYLAGFFDGEGSIFIKKWKANANRRELSHHYSVGFSVTNSHLETLKWIQGQLGFGAVYRQNPRKAKLSSFAVYSLHLNSSQAIAVLKKIQPWIRVKASRAIKAIRFWKTQYLLTGGSGGSKQVPLVLRIQRERMYLQFRRLNRG